MVERRPEFKSRALGVPNAKKRINRRASLTPEQRAGLIRQRRSDRMEKGAEEALRPIRDSSIGAALERADVDEVRHRKSAITDRRKI